MVLSHIRSFQRTTTLVLDKIKPLVLILKNPDRKRSESDATIKPDENIDQVIDSLGHELRETLNEHSDAIRNEIQQTKPQPNEENYEQKKFAYIRLVTGVTRLINMMSEEVKVSLIQFRQLINQLWDQIQSATDEVEAERFVQEFQKKTTDIFDELLSKFIKTKRDEIENNVANSSEEAK